MKLRSSTIVFSFVALTATLASLPSNAHAGFLGIVGQVAGHVHQRYQNHARNRQVRQATNRVETLQSEALHSINIARQLYEKHGKRHFDTNAAEQPPMKAMETNETGLKTYTHQAQRHLNRAREKLIEASAIYEQTGLTGTNPSAYLDDVGQVETQFRQAADVLATRTNAALIAEGGNLLHRIAQNANFVGNELRHRAKGKDSLDITPQVKTIDSLLSQLTSTIDSLAKRPLDATMLGSQQQQRAVEALVNGADNVVQWLSALGSDINLTFTPELSSYPVGVK